ncbi:MAG: POTRA domain-containing protein [Gammaproteobacteria bacterium]
MALSLSRLLRRLLVTLVLAVCGSVAMAPAATTETADASAEEDAATADTLRFDIWEYRVTGVTLVEARAIEKAVYAHLGPDRTIEDVEAAALAVETVYKDAGYGATIFVNIPEQDVAEGLVVLDVTEGTVERLRVTGSRYFDLDRIKAKVPALAPGEAPHLPSMQEQLTALNAASANRRVTPVLRPARSVGMVDVDLEVEDRFPLHGGLEFTNQYVRDTSETRLSGDLRYENLWQREHSIGFSFQLTPEDPNEVRVFSGTYLLRPEDSNWLLAAYGVKSDSDVTAFSGDAAGGIGVLGRGFVVGARAIRPLPALHGLISNITFGFDYKDFDDEISVAGSSESIFNPVSYYKFVAGWGGMRAFDRFDLRYNLDLHFSTRELGNSDRVEISGIEVSEFSNKRAFARSNFVYLRSEFSLTHAMPWESALRFGFLGQLASVALISNEQLSVGGVDTVHGYFESQTLADNAAVISVKWTSPSLHQHLPGDLFQDVRLFAFSEGARAMLIDPLPGSDAGWGLASLGFGMQTGGRGFGSELIWAWPLIDAEGVDAYDPRFHWQMSYDF